MRTGGTERPTAGQGHGSGARQAHLRERGVALLITLLVTTLLMALVFEFAYDTRVSLRAAANFRDSQRAYFLARSGINVAGRFLAENRKQGKLQDNLEQRDWQIVPIVSAGDTELRVRWEDEVGKINIANMSSGQESLARLETLFSLPSKRIGLDVLDRMRERKRIWLPEELHQLMSDEEYGKLRDLVTVYSGSGQIDINTAPAEVLQSLGLSESLASLIIEKRGREPFTKHEQITNFPGMDTTTSGKLEVTSDVFFVQAYATVGGYTRQAEAVLRRSGGGFTVLYWKIV